MGSNDPMLFRGWNAYMRLRQTMASSIVLNSSGWDTWNVSHAKVLAVFLWEYEGNKVNEFRYNKVLRKHAYRRTHNYKLLNDLLKSSVLLKAGRGTYSLNDKSLKIAEKATAFMKQADHICHENPERQDCSIK